MAPLPDGLPPFLIDRSLGNVQLVAALRARGIECHTLADVWGEDAAMALRDGEWLKYAQLMGMVCLTADKLRDITEAERYALEVRVFVIPRGNLSGAQQCERVIGYLDGIRRTLREIEQPWIINLEKTQMRAIWPAGLVLPWLRRARRRDAAQ